MNSNHAKVCGSQDWADYLCQEVLPATTAGIALGGSMLEVGPGPGAATGWLCQRAARLTALEADSAAAAALAEKYPGITVSAGDATAMSYPDGTFDTVASFTVLHHIPTAAEQYRMLAEALRVLRPGGYLIGSDSLASNGLHEFHECDTYNPVEPAVLLVRLQALGFGAIMIRVHHELIFTARKPVPGEDDACPSDTGGCDTASTVSTASRAR